MRTPAGYPRMNIYLDDPLLREAIKITAARRGTTASACCLDPIRQRLTADGYLAPPAEAAHTHAAETPDRLRREIGPLGIPVRDLIADGR